MQLERLYSIYQKYPNICTDTRQIAENCMFFALKGANFNGNTFAKKALEQGARYVVIDEPSYQENTEQYILVEDVLTTLQQLAKYHRSKLTIPVIGITGTNGKTTTKELIYAVLSQKYKTSATVGNLNNHIGVPLTLLAVHDEIEVAIVEMGANHVGEIALLASLAQPTYGLITNVGKAHLEGFGSFDGVKKAKGELYDYLSQNDAVVLIQQDNPLLVDMLSQRSAKHIVRYGFSPNAKIFGKLNKANPYLSIFWQESGKAEKHLIATQLTGSYNTENVLAAICIGRLLNIDPESIRVGIKNYLPKNNRSQITKTEKNVVIADFYNANVSSMSAALENLSVIEGDKKVLILGDMFEMGDESSSEHLKLVQQAEKLNVTHRFFVGKAFYEHRTDNNFFFQTTDEAKEYLEQHPLENHTILLKGSRGMAFEKIMEIL